MDTLLIFMAKVSFMCCLISGWYMFAARRADLKKSSSVIRTEEARVLPEEWVSHTRPLSEQPWARRARRGLWMKVSLSVSRTQQGRCHDSMHVRTAGARWARRFFWLHLHCGKRGPPSPLEARPKIASTLWLPNIGAETLGHRSEWSR